MKQTILTLQGRSRTLTSYLDNLDINTDAIKELSEMGTRGMSIWRGFYDSIKNEEEYKKLSPIEQQALHENSRSYGEVLTQIDQEIKYLTNTKHPLALQDCMAHLTSANIIMDAFIEQWGGNDGRLSYTKLKYVKDKGWDKLNYLQKVFNLITELDLLVEDFGVAINNIPDPVSVISKSLLTETYVSLVQSLAWLNSEYDRVKKEGMPNAREFTLPEIQVPAIPEDGVKDQPKKSKK